MTDAHSTLSDRLETLAGLRVPGPTVIALTAPFWEAAAEGRLLIQRCGACGDAVFYPREICPHCWADSLEWDEASGKGTLDSFTVIHKPGHPGWGPAAPYVLGLVRLEEGPVMLSHILSTPPFEEVAVGMALQFAPTDVGGRVLPLFKAR